MPIIIDDEPRKKGMEPPTVGQVLEEIKTNYRDRLVVQVLIDGAEMEASGAWDEPVGQRTMYVRTADRRQLALEALAEAERILNDSDADRSQAVDELSAGQTQQAMAPLSRWLASWQQVPKALVESAQAVGIDTPISKLMAALATQLREIQDALQSRDYVTLSDILNYESPETIEQWRGAISGLIEMIHRGTRK